MPTEDAYSSGHLVLSHFGTCMCSNVETNLSWTCLVSGLLNFEHPSVLLFCFFSFIIFFLLFSFSPLFILFYLSTYSIFHFHLMQIYIFASSPYTSNFWIQSLLHTVQPLILKPRSYGENMLMCANLHMSRFAHVNKSNLLCVQTSVMYREQILETSFEIRK